MKYYQDDYLQRLTESEPFGGWRIRENKAEKNELEEIRKYITDRSHTKNKTGYYVCITNGKATDIFEMNSSSIFRINGSKIFDVKELSFGSQKFGGLVFINEAAAKFKHKLDEGDFKKDRAMTTYEISAFDKKNLETPVLDNILDHSVGEISWLGPTK